MGGATTQMIDLEPLPQVPANIIMAHLFKQHGNLRFVHTWPSASNYGRVRLTS